MLCLNHVTAYMQIAEMKTSAKRAQRSQTHTLMSFQNKVPGQADCLALLTLLKAQS